MTEENRQNLSNRILGALIGLVMSCESNEPTDHTTPIIIEGIRTACGTDSNSNSEKSGMKEATEQDLLELINRIHEEKFTIVPNCRTCASPCGNTSDYDMERIRERSPEKQLANRNLLKRLKRIAREMPDDASDEEAFVLYQGLAALSFDWEPEELDEIGMEYK